MSALAGFFDGGKKSSEYIAILFYQMNDDDELSTEHQCHIQRNHFNFFSPARRKWKYRLACVVEIQFWSPISWNHNIFSFSLSSIPCHILIIYVASMEFLWSVCSSWYQFIWITLKSWENHSLSNSFHFISLGIAGISFWQTERERERKKIISAEKRGKNESGSQSHWYAPKSVYRK